MDGDEQGMSSDEQGASDGVNGNEDCLYRGAQSEGNSGWESRHCVRPSIHGPVGIC